MGKEKEDINKMLEREIEWQRAVKEMMEEILRFEADNHKLIGLEISAGLLGYLRYFVKKEGRREFDIFDDIPDSEVASLCCELLERIRLFIEANGGTIQVLVSRLLEETSRLGCLQVQNPERYPDAKMTH